MARNLLFTGSLLVLASQIAMGQYVPEHQMDRATMKELGLIPQPEKVRWNGEYPSVAGANRGGGCWIPFDASYTTVLSGVDDATTGEIALPFTFCLYGVNYNSMFINSNGNITFGASSTAFTSVGMPNATYTMIAPFWADADTRGIGDVRYKINPTHAVITWNNVGYYNTQTNLTNTCQVVITNGSDPILSAGNNVRFAYQDMQWTTGSASGGTGGFGGTAATAGINAGDGTNFIVIGEFDQNNSNYDGPGGSNDGVSYLDNQCFEFAVCTNQNIPPSLVGFSTTTYNLCVGQTATVTGTAIGPESGQTVTFTINNGGLANVATNTNTPGNPANLSLTITATAADVGTHTVVVTATDNGTPVQTSTVSITVNVSAGPVPTIAGPSSACPGGTVALSASAGFTSYAWSPSGGNAQTANVGPGAYTVTVTDASGCSGTSAQYIVNQDASPTPFITGPTTVCPGSTVTLTADAGYSSYAWSPSGGSAQTADVPDGTYTVSVTTAGGCIGVSQPFTVTQSNNIVPVIVGDNSLCPGQSATLDAGAGYDSYVWTPGGQTTQSITVGLGTYSVSVVDGVCAGSSVQFTVATAPDLTPVIVGTSGVCSGNATVLDAGAGFASYSWNPSGSTQTVTVGAGQYTVTVTDSDGCSGTSPLFNVTLLPDLSPTVTGGLNYCSGAGATLDAGSGYATYAWSPGGANTQNVTLAAGTYTVTVTDNLGCSGTSQPVSVTNDQPQAPVITGPGGVCGANTVTLDAGVGYVSYTWNPTGGNGQTAQVGAGTYTVTVSTGPGCSATSQPFTVQTGTAPSPFISGPLYYCVNEANGVNLSADPGYVTYTWSPGGFNTADVFVPAGNYTLQVTDGSGCIGTATFTVTQIDNAAIPIITPDGPTIFCQTGTVVLSGPADFSEYIWSTGSFTPNITVWESGTYILYVTDSLGCTSPTNSIDITVEPFAIAAFSPAINQYTADFLNLSQNATSYEWHFGDGTTDTQTNPSHTYAAGGVYDVMLVAFNDCQNDTAYLTISVMNIGMDEADSETSLIMWPNPAFGEVRVHLDAPMTYLIEMTDATGRVVFEKQVAGQSDGKDIRLSTVGLSEGLYNVRLTSERSKQTGRLVINH
jgi:PKD repeat protein